MEEHNRGSRGRLEREASPTPAKLQVFLSDQALQFLQPTIHLCTGSRLLCAGSLHLCTGFWGVDAQIIQELQGGPQGWLSEHQHLLQLLQVPEAWYFVTGGQEGPMDEQRMR